MTEDNEKRLPGTRQSGIARNSSVCCKCSDTFLNVTATIRKLFKNLVSLTFKHGGIFREINYVFYPQGTDNLVEKRK
jgi:hypothetical protein